jgi:pilus assembly protein Flp/PilA
MLQKMKNLVVQEEGQGLTEYGLIVGLVAVALVAALTLMATDIGEVFTKLKTQLDLAD